jgi:hypothetical protein
MMPGVMKIVTRVVIIGLVLGVIYWVICRVIELSYCDKQMDLAI